MGPEKASEKYASTSPEAFPIVQDRVEASNKPKMTSITAPERYPPKDSIDKQDLMAHDPDTRVRHEVPHQEQPAPEVQGTKRGTSTSASDGAWGKYTPIDQG